MTRCGVFGVAGSIALLAAMPALATPVASASSADDLSAPAAKQNRKPAGARGGGTITFGESREGTLRNGSIIYTLEAEAGQRLRIVLQSSVFDPVLHIAGPSGFVAENDDEPTGRTLNSLIDTRLPVAGTYRVTVSSFEGEGSGHYRLATLDPADPIPDGHEPRLVNTGETVQGILSASDPMTLNGANVDYYRFAGKQGERLTIEIESDRIDPFLTLYMPGGAMEVNDDRGAEDTNSRLSVTLPRDGDYVLAASSYSPGESGAYTVRLAEADSAIRTVRPAGGNAQVYALSVGVANYQRITPLNRTNEDAERVTHALRQAGVLAPQSVTLTDAEATRENFRHALGELAQSVGPDDTLLIFFSGHGEKVENMTTERDGSAETLELFDAALFDYELAEMMQGVDARTLLVIDACFAGGFDQVIDQRDQRMGVFSSDADTLSLVADGEKSGGYISHIFRQALEGAGDMNGDGAVQAGELSEFMRREFYRMVLTEPLGTDAEDFRDYQVPGFQHIIIDRGGDGMPFQQVLWDMGSATGPVVARAN